MFGIIQSILLSIIIIIIGHFVYFSLSEVLLNSHQEVTGRIVDFAKQSEEREKIMSSLREDEKEEEQLKEYVKSKLNILNTKDYTI